jgi:2-polyprenyl-3-methyl-5-hydroxy-6-metoxy-1,4-benzoquinol methylase
LGVDMSPSRIQVAKERFAELDAPGDFIASDIFKITELEHKFDFIICHDVLEHISNKSLFLQNIHKYLAPGGIVFMSFPAWQMAFGGHQQICRSKILSHLPFFHLLPVPVYRSILRLAKEQSATISELLNIKQTRCTIELFQSLVKQEKLYIINRRFYLINPHYEVKFGLHPRRLWNFIGAIPKIRNFFTSSCFYILRP